MIKPKFLVAGLKSAWLKLRYRTALRIDLTNVYIHPSVRVEIAHGGRIEFARGGRRIYVDRGSVLRSSGGVLTIGAGAFINQNCVVVAYRSVAIGAESMLGPNVCVIDADHTIENPNMPFANQGMTISSIVIGSNVWLAANVVVTRGSTIGDSTVVGANSTVRGVLERHGVYAGTPARLKRSIGPGA